MGTRNLTLVFHKGQFLVAQYCQWDGYPDGQGLTALTFARDKLDRDKFLTNLAACTHPTAEEIEGFYKSVGGDGSGWVNMTVSDKFKKKWPTLNRDMGAGVLEAIQNGPVPLNLYLEFAADSLFCEWAWLIDFDKGTFEAFKGFNMKPLAGDDRFVNMTAREPGKYEGAEQYYPIKLAASWPLDALPTDEDFLATFAEEDEEEGVA